MANVSSFKDNLSSTELGYYSGFGYSQLASTLCLEDLPSLQ
jgi:hypothetical protein